MMDNIFIRTDPTGNIKPDKEKSSEKIDGAVATIMALDRAIRCGNENGYFCDKKPLYFSPLSQKSIYSEHPWSV